MASEFQLLLITKLPAAVLCESIILLLSFLSLHREAPYTEPFLFAPPATFPLNKILVVPIFCSFFLKSCCASCVNYTENKSFMDLSVPCITFLANKISYLVDFPPTVSFDSLLPSHSRESYGNSLLYDLTPELLKQ